MRCIMTAMMMLVITTLLGCSSGSDDGGTAKKKIEVVSTMPQDGDQAVATNSVISVTFSGNIKIVGNPDITINDKVVSGVVDGTTLKIVTTLMPGISYIVKVLKPALTGVNGEEVPSVTFSFKTSAFDVKRFDIKPTLSNPNASAEAVNVYNFLKDNFGKKTIAGVMSDVSWNMKEVDWLFSQTGKYAAMWCVDYVFLAWPTADWTGYENLQMAQDWWDKNGIMSACWHWNVPKKQGDTDHRDMAFYTANTNFDVSKALVEGSYENVIVKADLAKIVVHLKRLQSRKIPLLWRPLHEASGTWFWWGAKGAQPCKELWIYMYEYFKKEGLNNLIWVWTSDGKDIDWYPGDEYVDMIGCDSYPSSNYNASQIETFNRITSMVNGKKIIAMSECSGVPDPAKMASSGDVWSWFMPWYGEQTHDAKYNSVEFFKRVFNSDLVITRDEMPNLK